MSVLILIIIFDILTKPHWQIVNLDLHFKCNPRAMSIEQFFKVVLLTLHIYLKPESPIIHGVLMTLLSASFTFSFLIQRPWNYNRLNWQLFILYVVFAAF